MKTLSAIKLKLYRRGAPIPEGGYLPGFPGVFTVGLKATTAGGSPESKRPTGPYLTQGSYDGDTLTTDPAGEWVTIPVTPYMITPGTSYAIVIDVPNGDAQNFVMVRLRDRTFPPFPSNYPDGAEVTSDDYGATWYPPITEVDYLFELLDGTTTIIALNTEDNSFEFISDNIVAAQTLIPIPKHAVAGLGAGAQELMLD
jgi:hypothetical protein